MVKEIFPGTKIATYHFDKMDNYLGKLELEKAMNETFEQFEIINSTSTEKYGETRTTVQHARNYKLPSLLNLENNELGKWIYSKITQGAKDLDVNKNKDYTKFKFCRTWMNRMYRNSHGAAHRHQTMCDMVCMFYYDAPPNCSELVFINDESALGSTTPYYKFPEEKRYHLQPKSGLFICHDQNIPHAIGINNTDNYRTVLVFEPFFDIKQ